MNTKRNEELARLERLKEAIKSCPMGTCQWNEDGDCYISRSWCGKVTYDSDCPKYKEAES